MRDQLLDKIPKLIPSPQGARVAAEKIRTCGEFEIRPKFHMDDAVTLAGAFKRVWRQFQKRKDLVDLRTQQELRRLRTKFLPLTDNQLPCWDLYDLAARRKKSYRRQISLNASGGR